MSKKNCIEMVYNEVEGVISFVYSGEITFEYKRFNGGRAMDRKGFQQILFEYLFENEGKLVLINDFIDNMVNKYPCLSQYRGLETRNALHNLFDFTSNPWIKLFFPIRQDSRYKFKNKVSLEELKEKELFPITIKRPKKR